MAKKFKGTSHTGDIKEALASAIAKAAAGDTGADSLIKWRLSDIKGQQGGFVGNSELTVTIEATIN